jgi:hypothetical protein
MEIIPPFLYFLIFFFIVELGGASLLWADVQHGRLRAVARHPVVYVFALIVFPSAMLALSFLLHIRPDDTWAGLVRRSHQGLAGLSILPLWVACMIGIGRAIARPVLMGCSRRTFVIAATQTGICAWYTVATGNLDLVREPWLSAILSLAPGLPLLTLVLLLGAILRQRRLTEPMGDAFAYLWCAGILATIAAKYFIVNGEAG